MKILIAEDDKISRRMLEKVFNGHGYEIVSAADGDEAWAVLEEPGHPHLLILDWMMPGITGVEIVRRLRERPDGHTYYIMILTSLDTPEDISFALDGGADEFVSKPYHAEALRSRANVGRRIVSLHESLSEKISMLEEAHRIISLQAATDELTGLFNRRYFNERYINLAASSRRYNFPVSLILTDLDKFKSVNDIHGHATGDEVLKIFAAIMKNIVRMEDVVARWGGEEFIMLLPHTTLDGAAVVAERIRASFASEILLETNLPLTSSFGVVELREKEESEEFINRADKALYRAKEEGRNRVVLG